MEQLRQLGGRLLGKKRVAVFLGLLGLCCPSSLWAEKLDTTFVLDIDMTIDMTPCYYTKYNGSGQIVGYGNYLGDDLENNLFGDYDQSCVNVYYRLLGGGYSRINIGIVTNEEGLPLDTLFYACDRVTKQWREVPSLLKDHQCSYEFYDNGMLGEVNYHEDQSYRYYPGDRDVTAQVPREMAYITYSKNGYPSKFLHETYRAAGLYQVKWGTESHEELYFDTWGNYSIWDSTTYDERHNLIQTVYKNIVCTHAYDSLDRRIKTVIYDAGYNVTDSVIYTYGHPLYWGKPYLLSLRVDGHPIQDFAPDKFQYDLSDSITYYNDIDYIAPYGSSVEQSYDKKTNIMTLTVKGANYSRDSTAVSQYVLTVKKPESYITALNIDGFSPEKYHYDNFNQAYYCGVDHYYHYVRMDSARYDYKISKDAKSFHTYDIETGILTITVKGADYCEDSTNVHTYTFPTKRIEIENVRLNSIKINEKELEGFSPDKFYYEFIPEYYGISSHVSYSDIYVNQYPNFIKILEKRDPQSPHTFAIYLYVEETYNTIASYHLRFLPGIRELLVDGVSLSDFSVNKYEYEVPVNYSRERVTYQVSEGIDSKESFDASTNMLTLSVFFADDSTKTTKYHIHFRPVDGVDDFLGDQVKLYVTGKTICVDGATEPVYVYNFQGALVGISRGEEVRIPVRQAGVYVVKAGGKAAKVVVK